MARWDRIYGDHWVAELGDASSNEKTRKAAVARVLVAAGVVATPEPAVVITDDML